MDLAAVRQVLPGCCPVLIDAVEKKGSVLQEWRVLVVGLEVYTGVGVDTASVHPNPNATPLHHSPSCFEGKHRGL